MSEFNKANESNYGYVNAWERVPVSTQMQMGKGVIRLVEQRPEPSVPFADPEPSVFKSTGPEMPIPNDDTFEN